MTEVGEFAPLDSYTQALLDERQRQKRAIDRHLSRLNYIGKFYRFKPPRGVSEVKWTSVKYPDFLIARSVLTEENFFVLPVMLEDLQELNEMEVLAWASH